MNRMNPVHFLTLGFDLAVREAPEYRRTAISRSYYGAYHVVVAALAEFEWFVSHASYGHDEAQELLKVSGDIGLKEASAKLRDLYNRRLDADYRLDLEHPETSGYAMSSWEIAMDVQRATEAMLTEPLRTQVATALAVTAAARALLVLAGKRPPHWRQMKRDKARDTPDASR